MSSSLWVYSWLAIAQPSMRRLNTSRTTASYRDPSPVGMPAIFCECVINARRHGRGLPFAIATQFANPCQVVSIVGDGSLAMLMAEPSTAVRIRLPVKVVVLHNDMLAEVLFLSRGNSAIRLIAANCASIPWSRSPRPTECQAFAAEGWWRSAARLDYRAANPEPFRAEIGAGSEGRRWCSSPCGGGAHAPAPTPTSDLAASHTHANVGHRRVIAGTIAGLPYPYGRRPPLWGAGAKR
ncbi:thiamine pyrophosphate-dependent enzyme [Paraburkholderia sp. HD33-4]|uniref:thiamine pyrophosphate-dependent enzyme n=1 Tax=Paraburkholderia sp. HD33-4 TaxID=2883242 RepID=UPI003FA3AD29